MSSTLIKTFGFTLGPSGIGKNYGVGRILEEYWGVHTFVSGDWCRDHAAEHAARGTLVNDELIVAAALNNFRQHGSPAHFLLDCPRSVEQVKRVIAFFKEADPTRQQVTWNMFASRATCEARLAERATRQGRLDDANPEVIARRLDTYFNSQTGILHTVVPYLADASDHFIHVDASVDLEEVRRKVHSIHAPEVYGKSQKAGIPAATA